MELARDRLAGLLSLMAEQALHPWIAFQMAVIAASIAAGFVINGWVEPRLEARVRAVRNWPRMLRLLAVGLRRTRWLLAAACLWTAAGVLRAANFPEGTQLVTAAAVLVTTWAAIAIASGLSATERSRGS